MYLCNPSLKIHFWRQLAISSFHHLCILSPHHLLTSSVFWVWQFLPSLISTWLCMSLHPFLLPISWDTEYVCFFFSAILTLYSLFFPFFFFDIDKNTKVKTWRNGSKRRKIRKSRKILGKMALILGMNYVFSQNGNKWSLQQKSLLSSQVTYSISHQVSESCLSSSLVTSSHC